MAKHYSLSFDALNLGMFTINAVPHVSFWGGVPGFPAFEKETNRKHLLILLGLGSDPQLWTESMWTSAIVIYGWHVC